MKLMDSKIGEYLDVLKSDAPAPGGGSVSALAGAQGAALFMMVAGLTIGKEKYAEDQEICETALRRGKELYAALTEAVDQDTDAFKMVSAAFQLPKETQEQKAERSKAISEATLAATEVPYRVMRNSYEGILLAKTMVGRSNPNAFSDLGVSLLNLLSAVKGAWLNVKINLPGIKNEEKSRAFLAGGQQIYDDSVAVAGEMYEQILKQL